MSIEKEHLEEGEVSAPAIQCTRTDRGSCIAGRTRVGGLAPRDASNIGDGEQQFEGMGRAERGAHERVGGVGRIAVVVATKLWVGRAGADLCRAEEWRQLG